MTKLGDLFGDRQDRYQNQRDGMMLLQTCLQEAAGGSVVSFSIKPQTLIIYAASAAHANHMQLQKQNLLLAAQSQVPTIKHVRISIDPVKAAESQ